MSYKLLFCFVLGLGLLLHSAQGMSLEQAQKIINEMSNAALLPTRAAAEVLLKGFKPAFFDVEGKEMLEKIYGTPNINNDAVGYIIAKAAQAYGKRTNRAAPAPGAFQGEDIYVWIESFLIRRDEDEIFTPRNKDEFLSGLARIESNFKDYFGELLLEHLYVEGMTVKRAEMIVDAVIMLQMRRFNQGALVVAYKSVGEALKAFILNGANSD
ncbi:hypothetical protein JST56_06510 [Candidatus Dependentiae bacterium]|jgi:hypothetical protein|nr:hypothetical protein [Candidatus Dependentiae bacterium]